MALPSPIMVSWRGFMLWPRLVAGRSAVDFIVMLANLLVVGGVVLVGHLEFTAPRASLRAPSVRAWWQFAGTIVVLFGDL